MKPFIVRSTQFSLVFLALGLGSIKTAHAIPAFAMREKVSCTLCHANGSAPHLTKAGYLYRRAGFRFPGDIGNREKDDAGMELTQHAAAGVNVSYEAVSNKAPGSTQTVMTSNNFNVPEVEVWPIVGGFLGNIGVWSEIDASPHTGAATVDPSVQTAAGDISLTQTDLRYVWGTADMFYGFRVGMMNPEGFGASDQWIDDGNLPLFDQDTANFNQDTLAIPFGAMEQPELGGEFQVNAYDSHLTLGVYNGFIGTNTTQGSSTATLNPALMSQYGQNSKDYKVQLDQFVLGDSAITAAYYNGRIPLDVPGSSTLGWADSYSQWRLYLTYQAVPGTVELLAGGAYGTHHWSDVNGNIGGQFNNKGAFLGGNYYAMKHLTISPRLDFNDYNTQNPGTMRAIGQELMASIPMDNSLFVFHFNHISSDVDGLTNDFRAEWRFLF